MLGNSAVVVVVRTRPRAIPLAKITMRKSTHGFPLSFPCMMSMGLRLAPLRAAGAPLQKYYYYMEEGVLLGTKPLVDSIRHFIRDPSGVFSVCHLCECRIVQ